MACGKSVKSVHKLVSGNIQRNYLLSLEKVLEKLDMICKQSVMAVHKLRFNNNFQKNCLV